MNGLPYYKRYPRDFIEGTLGMPFELKATYSVILDMIYLQGGNLPDDPRYISGVLGVSVRKWNSLRKGLVEVGKIQVIGDFLTNYRAVSELESLRKYQDNQREKASKPRKNKGLAKATAEPKVSHTEPEPYITEEGLPSSGKAPPQKMRIPEDWVPDDDGTKYALSLKLTHDEIKEIGNDFQAYWFDRTDARGRKSERGWKQAWRNWVRNDAPKVIRNRRVVSGAFPSRGGQGGGIAAVVARRQFNDPL